ncbi:hypothetical protein SD80_007550 [Scytonema tolypothrichoides VB-61278]|nr:hypothetical protein SD80_007550 [Scytonema tolypothrichoides VB-61278]
MKNQVSWQKRLQYNFDNFMSKGGLSVFLALLSLFFGTFVVMTIVRYISELLFPNTNNVESSSELYWEVFVQLIGLRDTGDNANLATKIIGVITIFLGLVLFSSLVAFITQEFESRLQILRQGQSPVIEENHTLILGFSDRIIDIIKELVVGNESEADAVVVILSQQEKEEMDNFLRNNLVELKTTRVVTRNGIITNLNDLNKVGIKVAKSVIILNDAKTSDPDELKTLADARVVKAVLAVVAANEEDSLPSIVVELHSQQYRRLAENIAPGAVTTLNEADILARILVQTSRSVGLAAVYLNLVGFEGNEFYFYRPEKGWQSVNFGELPFHFSNGIPIGVRHVDGTLRIKPSKKYQLVESDEAIVLAEDDSSIQFHRQPVVQPKNFRSSDFCKTLERKPEKHLIIGWNSKAPITLREYAKYLVSGSEVNLVVQDLTSQVKAEFDSIAKNYSQIKMDALQVNLDSVEQLLRLKPYEYNSISILALKGENSEEIDAKTLTILLELRQIFREYTAETKNQVTTELIAEIIDSQDTDLVIKAGVKDFLLTNQFVSKILAQVSQEPSVMSIYHDLFSVEGSELYIKPISLYFSSKQLGRLTFADCVKAAQERDELCLGVKISALAQNKNQNFGIDLVPSLDKPLNLTFNDSLITLAENET